MFDPSVVTCTALMFALFYLLVLFACLCFLLELLDLVGHAAGLGVEVMKEGETTAQSDGTSSYSHCVMYFLKRPRLYASPSRGMPTRVRQRCGSEDTCASGRS